MSTVAFIPARGGSKGLHRKNLAMIDGVSLVGRAVSSTHSILEIDQVVVSSDDQEILAEARSHGATAELRPPRLALDTTPTIEVVRDYLEREQQVEVIVLLQPTSPLRTADDIRACLTRLGDAGGDAGSVVTVTVDDHPPAWSFRLGPDERLEPLAGWQAIVDRRQDAAETFRLNGAVYAVHAERIRRGARLVDEGSVGVVMPRRRSVDIDDGDDLALARLLAEREAGS